MYFIIQRITMYSHVFIIVRVFSVHYYRMFALDTRQYVVLYIYTIAVDRSLYVIKKLGASQVGREFVIVEGANRRGAIASFLV